MTDNGACNVYALPTNPATFVAASETSLLRPIDAESLETLPKKIDLSSVVNIASARPSNQKIINLLSLGLKSNPWCLNQVSDPWTGDLYNLSGTFLTGLKYHFIKFPKDVSENETQATIKTVATIPSRSEKPTYSLFSASDK